MLRSSRWPGLYQWPSVFIGGQSHTQGRYQCDRCFRRGLSTSPSFTASSKKSPKTKTNQDERSASKAPSVIQGSTKHHDLASFLQYARDQDLDPTSNVYVGTQYEYTVSATLQHLSFDLTRTGRSSDLGIDLLGEWRKPGTPSILRVLLQCKAEKPRPSFIRELEGAYVGAPSGWHGDGVMALLVAAENATKGVREAISRSRWPMGFMTISRDGILKQFLWNQRAAEIGLEGVGVVARHRSNGSDQEVTLTWDGRPLKPH